LLLAFAHIHGEAGAPTEGIGSECGGGSERSGFVCRRGGGLLFNVVIRTGASLECRRQ
jgi:hypothetical protein